MNDEQTNATDTQGNPTDKPVETVDKSDSIVEEAKAIRDEIRTEREKLEAANDRQAKLQAEEMLGGTAGGAVKPTPAKEETPKEYNDRVEKEISEGKHDE